MGMNHPEEGWPDRHSSWLEQKIESESDLNPLDFLASSVFCDAGYKFPNSYAIYHMV